MSTQTTIERTRAGKTASKKGQADTFDIHVGQRLKELRKLKLLTQKDIANALGVSSQQIQKYEKGQDRVSFNRIYELSKFLNIRLESFLPKDCNAIGLSDSEQELLIAPSNDTLSGKEQREIFDFFESIPSPERRKTVIKLLQSMQD